MTGAVVGRENELAVMERLLDEANHGAMLVAHGEPGIGKSTLLAAAVQLADARQFTVLRTQGHLVEAQMGYVGLSDLLTPFISIFPALPASQRAALDVSLRREDPHGRPADLHTVAVATLKVLGHLAAQGPLLVAIDDLQWLDDQTRVALAFALRRCQAGITTMYTVRRGEQGDNIRFRPPDGGSIHELAVSGLDLASLHVMLRARMGQSFARPAMRRIAEVSGGNPLFALEVARGLRGETSPASGASLSYRLRLRLGTLPDRTRGALLLASMAQAPTRDLMERAVGAAVENCLAPAEDGGVVQWIGGQLVFCHPMWREVVQAAATPRQRRRAHRTLALLIDGIEQRARHRALSCVTLDPTTVSLLCAAATSARARGAPETAVELLEMALSLGAAEPALRMQLARDHLESGEPTRALELANDVAMELGSGPARAAALQLAGVATYQVEDFPGSASVLESAFEEAEGSATLRANIAIDLSMTVSNCGNMRDGLLWARRSVEEATSGKDAGVLAEARGGVAILSLMNGKGLLTSLVDQALAGEDAERRTPATRWPTLNAAMLSLWSHDLAQARQQFDRVRARCVALGTESGLWLALGRAAEAAVWDGDTAAADALVTEMSERAAMTGSRSVELMALAARAYVCAWCGNVEEARAASDRVVGLGDDNRHMMALMLAMACRGMAELSDDDPGTAATWLTPLADTVEVTGIGEPIFTPFVFDAIEAFVRTSEAPRAERLVGVLQRNAQRTGRSWSAGVAARGRGVLLADEGALDEAAACLRRALMAHEGAGLRYERARTLLLMGRLERRRRQRGSARDALQKAALLFDQVGAARWAANAREETRHLGLTKHATQQLTPSEQRVAELVASGLTNVVVAARLSISPKTVEANLSRVYRKLGIRSRAELGWWAAEHGSRATRATRRT